MAEDNAPPVGAPDANNTDSPAAAPQEGNVDDLPAWARDALKKANSEAASYRTKVKELSPLAAKAQELEEAQKTETQKLTERAAQAESDAAAARHELLRVKVAASKGLPSELAERLRGDNEKELAEDADRLLELVKPRGASRNGFDNGARETADNGTDMNNLLRQAAGKQ